MKNEYSLPVITTQDRYQYSLIVHPDSPVHNKIMEEKQWFAREYNQRVAFKTKPHITVANIFAREAMVETIIRWMQRVFSRQPCFTVTLNNYSGFPAHAIYLRVQKAKPFHQLARELKVIDTYVSSCSCPLMKLSFRPYLSIARRLPEEVYFKALAQYAHKSFHESFLVNELLLLKRKHQYDTCKAVNVFALQPGN